MKKIFTVFMTLLLSLTMLCAPQTVSAAPRISKNYVTITAGKSKTIKIKGTKKKVVWKSSNKSIATVSKGKIRAKKQGSCTITAKVAGRSFTCYVTVKAKKVAQKTVYITETGSKYHSYEACRGLNNAKAIYKSSLSSAKSQGFTPCAWCY